MLRITEPGAIAVTGAVSFAGMVLDCASAGAANASVTQSARAETAGRKSLYMMITP